MQELVTYPVTPSLTWPLKILCWNPSGSPGFFEHKPPVSPCRALSLLQTPTFLHWFSSLCVRHMNLRLVTLLPLQMFYVCVFFTSICVFFSLMSVNRLRPRAEKNGNSRSSYGRVHIQWRQVWSCSGSSGDQTEWGPWGQVTVRNNSTPHRGQHCI